MKQILQIIWVLALCITISGCESTKRSNETTVDSTISGKVDAYLNAWVANKRFNGNVLIAKGDSVLYAKSFGLANREFGIPNAESTKFLIGSITKPFTAYAILLLEQKAKLSLEDKLSKYFPDFPNADRISIQQLLTHTSGITDYHAFKNWKNDSKLEVTPQYTVSTLLERPSIFEPGERFSYSNSGYIFLGLIIEKVTGQTFAQYIQAEILEPQGLTGSGVAVNTHVVPELATGYTSSPRETLKAEYINYAQPFASGNMYSTPQDLWKFSRAVMSSAFLPAEKTNEIFNWQQSYGYGWGIRDYDGVTAYGHYGAMNGFVGAITYLPVGEYFLCFLTNDDTTPEYTITEDLIGILNGKQIEIPKRTTPIPLTEQMKAHVIGEYLVKKGDTLKVFEEDNRLFLQETSQSKHELFPVDSLEFSFALFEFNAVFSTPGPQYSDTLKFTGKSNVVANRINGSGH